jgi:hypothetical protein
MVIFGIGLAMTQFRLHYFGSFALILGWTFLISHYFPAVNRKPLITSLAFAVIFLLAYLPPIQHRIFVPYSLGFDGDYEELYPILMDAEQACADEPGIILVDNNLGHIVRYHTDCSVIANNFLMTPQHEAKIEEMNTLLNMSAEDFLEQDDIKITYVLARLQGYVGTVNGKPTFATTEWLEKNIKPLQFQLTSRSDLPTGYQVLAELPIGDGKRDIAMARLVKIVPEIAAAAGESGDTGS